MSQSDQDLLETFLMAGADIYNRSTHGTTPLQLACIYNHLNHATALIAAGARIDEEDNDGDSSLFDAVHNERSQIVQMLLQHGAQIHNRNNHGHTVLHMLALWGTLDTIKPFMSPEVEKLDAERKDGGGHTS